TFPLENCSIGSCARAVARAENLLTGVSGNLCNSADVGCPSGPGDQSRLVQRSDINVKIVSRLQRVRRDDFQILPAAEREEGVPGAGPRVSPADDRFHSSLPFNPGNSPIKIS